MPPAWKSALTSRLMAGVSAHRSLMEEDRRRIVARESLPGIVPDTSFPAVRQYRLASLQEAPDGGIASKADRDVEGIASLGIGMGSGQ